MVDLEELKGLLDADLDKAVISAMTLLSRFRFLDDRSKITGAYSDPRFVPFYYHLGKRITPRSLLHAGFGLGIESGAFLLGCNSVEDFFAFQDPMGEYYSSRTAKSNIKDKYKGRFECAIGAIDSDLVSVTLSGKEWDAIIVTEFLGYDAHRSYFDILWSALAYNGLMIVDHVQTHEPNKQALEDFCKIVNREPAMLTTRYGVAIVKK